MRRHSPLYYQCRRLVKLGGQHRTSNEPAQGGREMSDAFGATATRFGATSTTEDVLSGVKLRGKRILVTGVSAGLGVETARALAAHGAAGVGGARDLGN